MVLDVVSTQSTAQRLLIPVRTVIPTDRALPHALAFRQAVDGHLCEVIPLRLPSMTCITKMSGTPAKPLSNRTTKLTLKLDLV